jgi:hypothetical protein
MKVINIENVPIFFSFLKSSHWLKNPYKESPIKATYYTIFTKLNKDFHDDLHSDDKSTKILLMIDLTIYLFKSIIVENKWKVQPNNWGRSTISLKHIYFNQEIFHLPTKY